MLYHFICMHGLCMYLMLMLIEKKQTTEKSEYDQEMPQSRIESCWLVPYVVLGRVHRGAT